MTPRHVAGPRVRGAGALGRRGRVVRALASALALGSLAAPAARAQSAAEPRASAHALFEQGRALLNAGRYAEACTKLEESHQVEPAPGTLLNLADCYERIGRTATAWELFLDVAALAQSAGRAQHETMARARAQALEPKLSKLRVTVSAPAAGLSVHRDGIVLEPSEWGAAFPVDPGQHVIEASAPHKWEYRIMRYVPPGAALVTVDVPPLVDQSSARPKPPPPSPARPEAPGDGPGGGWRRPLGYATVGLGLAAAGAGTFFFGDYTFRDNDPNGNYEWEKPASLYAFVGAGVLLGAGLYFLLSGPPSKAPASHAASGAVLVW